MRLRYRMVAGFFALALAAASVVPVAVHADGHRDGDDDHDMARDLHEGGEIRALSEILREIQRKIPGDIVAIDLVRANDRWVYRVQVVSADGQRSVVDVDAGAGTPFHDEGRD